MKHRSWSGLAMAFALLFAAGHAHGQKATEQFIPIGQSPGASGRYTVVGVIEAVSPQGTTVTVRDSARTLTARITTRTRIFLDRSKLKLPNLSGRLADLQKGRRAEVKFLNPARRDTVDWVKVEVAR